MRRPLSEEQRARSEERGATIEELPFAVPSSLFSLLRAERPFLLFAGLMLAVAGGAAALRLANLGNRPMHCDEAGQAIKFGRLLEEGDYVYDPHEYHGPSLNFLTLPIARLAAARNLTELTEVHLRLLPAIFGILLVGLLWLIRDELGRPAAFWAAVLTAVSPAMVFYSRYYIQEMLLVCFTFGAIVALWRFARHLAAAAPEELHAHRRSWIPKAFWLVLLGTCIGMMHASKETCVIPLFAMALAAALTIRGKREKSEEGRAKGHFAMVAPRSSLLTLRSSLKRFLSPFVQPVLLGVAVALVAASVSALFFSSFFDNPRGVVDSYSTYFHYFARASGEGTTGPHDKPWYDYLQRLFWWHRQSGPLWTEAPIAGLALVGLVAAWRGRSLTRKGVRNLLPERSEGCFAQKVPDTFSCSTFSCSRFLSVYAVLMMVIYSAMPYKTPWCALGFLHGMILLGGTGAAVLVRAAPGHVLKAAAVILLVAAAGHLGWQAWRASFLAYEDPNNPYVYAHTTRDVPLLAQRVKEIAEVHPDAQAMHIQVICPHDDHWPLPWYLRGFSHVDWFPGIPRGRAAPLIITRPEMEPALADYLYVKQPPGRRHLYVPVPPDQRDGDWQLRPNVPLRAYVRLDLWEAYRAQPRGAGG